MNTYIAAATPGLEIITARGFAQTLLDPGSALVKSETPIIQPVPANLTSEIYLSPGGVEF